jgi:ribonuclease HI
MSIRAPHFLLKTESRRRNNRACDWHFVLQTADGRQQVEVEDSEPNVPAERLELLAVVRGLEAIDSPAKVTLQTSSNYVRRGIHYGLDDWRENNWQWEWHGKMVPVKNGDLWRRLDRALQVHDVECQLLRIDAAHQTRQTNVENECESTALAHDSRPYSPLVASKTIHRSWLRSAIACRRWWREAVAGLRLRIAQFGTNLFPKPWLE